MNFTLTLTGSADSTTDVVLPLSSFSLRLRDSAQDSYLSCVIPDVSQYGLLVSARPNGNLQLQADWLMIDCPLTDIRLLDGSRQSSVRLTGYGSVNNPAPQTVTISKAIYSNDDPTGSFRLRAPLQQLLPGDTVIFQSVSRDIETISVSANSNQTQMELSMA